VRAEQNAGRVVFHVPQEETLEREGLERLQRRKLAAMLEHVRGRNAFYRRKLDGVRFDAAGDPVDSLPLTTRAELEQDQGDHPPYGTNLTEPLTRYVRLHQTSGSAGTPLRWLDTAENWEWWKRCWGIIYAAAGVRDDDRFLFPFSFGPFIGFWGAFEAAVALGHLSLAAGGMSTPARLRFMLENAVTVVCCTPTYALRMAEVAAEEGIGLVGSPVRALIVAGEPGGSIVGTRQRIETAWGARVFDHWGMTEIGPLAFECLENPGGIHLMETDCIPEVIDPQTCVLVPDGESGELVVTNLGRWASPLIRYRTGDQVRATRGRCPCARSFARLGCCIRERLDNMLIVRGHNVYPSAIEGIIREFPQAAEFRVRAETRQALSELVLQIEPASSADAADLARRVAEAVRDRLNVRPVVELVAPGSLPRFEMKARRVVRADGSS